MSGDDDPWLLLMRDKLRRERFKRDFVTLMGHVQGGLRGDGFGVNARACLDKMYEITVKELEHLDAFRIGPMDAD